MQEYEISLYDEGYKMICGVDEAGRGPLAGPVYAAAVVFPKVINIPGLNDSKKISENKRNELFDIIIEKALTYAVASASVEEIESINILNAVFLAMNRAVELLTIKPDMVLVDGNQNKGLDFVNRCIVGGDGKSASIAAASILAKVTRDKYMLEMSAKYPLYGFEKHKGYGTAKHIENIQKYGITEIHRKSFLRKILSDISKEH